MLVSVKSLRKLVDLSLLSAEDIALKLTFAGIEVEEITKIDFFPSLPNNIENKAESEIDFSKWTISIKN